MTSREKDLFIRDIPFIVVTKSSRLQFRFPEGFVFERHTVIPWPQVGFVVITNRGGAQPRVSDNHFVSNKRELNNCFLKFSNPLDNVDISVWSKWRDGTKRRERIAYRLSETKLLGRANEAQFSSEKLLFQVGLQICPRSGKTGQRINGLVVLLKIISGTSKNYSSSSRQMNRCFTCLIISMTKISIVIGSLCAYLCLCKVPV